MEKADLVLKNGKVYSVKLNGERIRGEAVAVKDGRIQDVGNDEAVEKLIGEKTRVIDCGGNTILPGMCDAHCHPSISASFHIGCNLFGLYVQEGQDAQEITDKYMERLEEYIKRHEEDELIRGIGWVKSNYTDDSMPTRHDIDRICSDRPVILESFCQHNLWVNTKALEIAGIDENYPDPRAGTIYRGKDGYPTGVFSEPEAMDAIKMRVPGYDFTVGKYKEAIKIYQASDASKYGVTLVQDCMCSDNAIEAYSQLAKEGDLKIRVRGVNMLTPKSHDEELKQFTAEKGSKNHGDVFRIDTVKIFAEGGFALNEPYEPDFLRENCLEEGYRGEGFWEDKELQDSMEEAMKAGFDIHVHAMGDASVKQSARCLSNSQKKTGIRGRNVIAHLMLVDDESVSIMSEAGIMGNCQPRWMVYDSDIAAMVPMMGEERAVSAYPYRKLLDRNIRVAFGTDFPVTPPPNPFHEIQCAMTRQVFPDALDYEAFKGRVLGNERPATLLEAIQSLTINGAYQMNLEDLTGSIEIGKSADLAILDSDLEAIPVDRIYSVEVFKTIFKGNIVYEKR